MENFVRFKLMGGHITLKPDVVPHKFACQPNGKNGSARKRPISAKRERKPFIVGEFVEVKEERSTAFDEDVYSGGMFCNYLLLNYFVKKLKNVSISTN